jgi:uncharacterized membrane protein YbhN (UPF0104 family)
MEYLLSGVLLLAAAVAVLWLCMPKNGRPVISTGVAPYIAVAVTMGLFVGFGATIIGFIRFLLHA